MLDKISLFLRMIKFSHSVFALPFAITSAMMAAGGLPAAKQVFWIAVAMVGARSGAMAMNRIVDRRIDALNPRTRGRELPAGKLGLRETALFAAVSFAVLIFAAGMLNRLCFALSPVAVAVVIFYSFTKRFTWAAHAFLGLAVSLAPVGAWIAVRGSFDAEVFPLMFSVVFWLAGFDVLYALQDMDFDRRHGLFSFPARFGTKKSLIFSRICHLMTVSMLSTTGMVLGLGAFYWIGIVVVSVLFVYEHSLVRENDLSRLNMAFFNMNGWISVTVLAFTAADYLL